MERLRNQNSYSTSSFIERAEGLYDQAEFSPDGALMAVVLIVEDEIFISMVAGMTIESLGHSILVAENVEQALGHLAGPDPIDAIFVDLRLQRDKSGGFEVARQAINTRPDLRVLYTSGSNLTADMETLFVKGGQFLRKPYSPEHLVFAFEKLLA